MGITALENLLAPLSDRDFGDQPFPFDALWENQCFLSQVDQDYDGLGDPCDLCPFAFDPDNLQYIDINGRLWPTDGKYCNGDYLVDNICDRLETPGPGTTAEESGSGSGEESGTGGATGTGGGSGG